MAFPFAVEMWNENQGAVERPLALTATGQIAFAAFHEALKIYPERYITLRREQSIIAQAKRGGPRDPLQARTFR
jgi:hypothetical protein